MGRFSTIQDFRVAVLDLLESHKGTYVRSLEEYLRSLWQVINQEKDADVGCELIFMALQKAFVATPLAFDEQWLKYEQPLDWDYQNGEYVIEGWDADNNKPIVLRHGVSSFELLAHTILFQIADLYRMRDNELKNEWKYYGIQSPTGNSWYNFDVFTYLECGTRGFEPEAILDDCDWDFLASILKLGRIYE